jgi:hypothetical protein
VEGEAAEHSTPQAPQLLLSVWVSTKPFAPQLTSAPVPDVPAPPLLALVPPDEAAPPGAEDPPVSQVRKYPVVQPAGTVPPVGQ